MECHITDGPQFEDDHEPVTIPNGLDLYGMLPDGLADLLVCDEIDGIHEPSNRSYLAQIFHLDSEGGRTGDWLHAMDKIHKILNEVREKVGESHAALEWWLRNVSGE
jgi:hypothetical protein